MNYFELLISQSARSLIGNDLLVSTSIWILIVGIAMFINGIFTGLDRAINAIISYLFLPVGIFILISLWLLSAPMIVILAYIGMAAFVTMNESLYKQKRRIDLEILLMERRHRIDMEENSREN